MSVDPFEKWNCEACKQKIDTGDERALEYYHASGLRFCVYCYADNVPRELGEDLLDAWIFEQMLGSDLGPVTRRKLLRLIEMAQTERGKVLGQ